MDEMRALELAKEADALLAEDPQHFDPPGYNQPQGMIVKEAQELLGEDAPWHQVAAVAHALREEEEEEEDSLPGVSWSKADGDRVTLAYDPAHWEARTEEDYRVLSMPVDEAKTLFRSLGITLGIAGHEVPDIPSTLYSPGQPIGG